MILAHLSVLALTSAASSTLFAALVINVTSATLFFCLDSGVGGTNGFLASFYCSKNFCSKCGNLTPSISSWKGSGPFTFA